MKKILLPLFLLASSPCYAVDFTTVITDEDDQPVRECMEKPAPKDPTECKDTRPLTLGMVVLRALAAPEQGLGQDESLLRGQLGTRLYRSRSAELTPEETVLIKKQVSKFFNPLLTVKVFRLIDPTVK